MEDVLELIQEGLSFEEIVNKYSCVGSSRPGLPCCGLPLRRWRKSIESFGDYSENTPKSNCVIFSAWSNRYRIHAFGRADRRGIERAGVAPFRDGDGIYMKILESKLINGQPGSLRFRLAWDTVAVMVERFAITSIEGQKGRAVIMENVLAEMRAQRPVQDLVTNLGWPPRDGSRHTKNEDLSSPSNKARATLQRLSTLENVASQITCKG